MIKKTFNLFDYFFILRPLILIPCWDFLLIGCYLARQKTGWTPEIIMGLIIYTMVMGGVYILNQIMDIATDKINQKLFLLSGEYISVRSAYIQMSVLWVIALVLSFQFSTTFVIFIVLSLLIGILYSLPPVKLKGKPILDTLSNGIGYGMINFAIGWLIFKSFDWAMFLIFLPYCLSICAVFINTTIVDIEGDIKTGEITSAVLLREKLSYTVSTVLMAGAVVASIIRRDLICLIPAAVSFPLFVFTTVYFYTRKTVNQRFTIVSFRLPGLLFTIATIFLYPIYAAVLLVIIVGMRIYYRKRFGIAYPTLSGG